MPRYRPMRTAPRDGTPVILLCGDGVERFAGYWGWAGRYTGTVKAWIGHESGYHDDGDLLGWLPFPAPPTRRQLAAILARIK